MKKMTSAEARHAFLEFFEENGHEIVASSSLVPGNDPTLLFTNAGMVQFKDVFLGLDQRPYSRATTSQKCMRITGKHNDLENVGPSPRHHTFFEMLGNFSFGDYFKRDAIQYAYDLLTQVYEIPADRLVYTVHTEDDDAFDIWVDGIGVPAERVLRMGAETNFWQMADTGPCGPTSEIHYDFGAEHHNCEASIEDCSVALDNGCNRWLEIWNLVFMQFNQDETGHRENLPAPGVDTGMGLERILAVLYAAQANYDTDLFMTIMDRTQEVLHHSEKKRAEEYVAYRVIADHTRAASFLIADGVEPGADGREYITRMLIRRAWRFAHLMGVREPFLAEVADAVIDLMGDHYPELRRFQEGIRYHISAEERRFRQTLERGLVLMDEYIAELQANETRVLSGESAFFLYATHGIPFEITRDILKEYDLDADEPAFREALEQHRVESESDAIAIEGQELFREVRGKLQSSGDLPDEGVHHDPYGEPSVETKLLAIVGEGKQVASASKGQRVSLVLAETPFYAEAGGQVSDTGTIEGKGWQVRVDDTRMPVGGMVVHLGEVVKGKPKAGQTVTAAIDVERRRDIIRNHTATHLLHRTLRHVLGEHVRQKGSLVAPDRLRFDFSHDKQLSQEELDRISREINEAILANYRVTIEFKSLKQAENEGAMALFGEKYSSDVRTITIWDNGARYSYELCGGNHVTQTAEIGPFVITSQESSGGGVRRITALTGRAAQRYTQERLMSLNSTSTIMRIDPANIEEGVQRLQDELQQATREANELRMQVAQSDADAFLERSTDVKGVPVLATVVPNADHDALGHMADRFKERNPSSVVVLGSAGDNGAALVAAVSKDLVQRGLHAGKLVGAVAKMLDGSGGGQPTFAKGGGGDSARLEESLASVPQFVADALDG